VCRGGDRPPPIRPLPCRVRTWPWTAKRVLSATVLPEDIVAVIAHLSFEPFSLSGSAASSEKRPLCTAARSDCTMSSSSPTVRASSSATSLVFSSASASLAPMTIGITTAAHPRHESAPHCSVCGLTVCARCWHRLSHQRCVCARGFAAGGGMYEGASAKRVLKF
jgi:hypothetical protein